MFMKARPCPGIPRAGKDRTTPMETDRTAPLSESTVPAPLPFRRDDDAAERPATSEAHDATADDRRPEVYGQDAAGAWERDGELTAPVATRDDEPRRDGEGEGAQERDSENLPQPWEPGELALVGAAGAQATAARRPGRVRAVFRETLETVLLALLIFVSVRAVIQNFKVEGSSMEPNLHSGQYLLVNKAAYFAVDLSGLGLTALFPSDGKGGEVVVHPFGAPNRGDVIVFRYPKDPRRDFIKRVIAVPGDTVEIRMGKVLVNGQMLNEPYIVENPAYSKEPQVVPADNYYVLGDNRNNSSDSHVWGPVPREFIIGKAWLSYWPLSEWGLAPNYTVAAQDAPAP